MAYSIEKPRDEHLEDTAIPNLFITDYMPDVPDKAAINEAVELAKHYEPPETVSFINGVLGSFSRNELKGEDSEPV